MEKLRNVIGLPLLETETGTQIGEVKEAILDIEGAMVCGIVIDGANWLVDEQGIAFDQLFSLGRDAIMIRNDDVVRPIKTIFALEEYCYLRDLFDKEIFTEAGVRLGVLVDIIFDSVTGEIKYYQLSDSIITDLLYGRMIMPLPQVQVVGNSKLIVPEGMIELIHADAGIC